MTNIQSFFRKNILYVILMFLSIPLSSQIRIEAEDAVVDEDVLSHDNLTANLWDVWSTDVNKTAWSGGVVLRSPVVAKNRTSPDEGAPVLHLQLPVPEDGVYSLRLVGGFRPLGMAFKEGEEWRKFTRGMIFEGREMKAGVFDLWFDDCFAAEPPATLGSCYLDYFELIRLGTADNGVMDSSFEEWNKDGKPAGWLWFQLHGLGECRMSDDAHSGTRSFHAIAPGPKGEWWTITSPNRLAVEAGQTYEMRGWVKLFRHDRDFRLEVTSRDRDGKVKWWAGQSRYVPRLAPTGEWQELVGYYTVESGVEEINLRVNGFGKVDALFDDFSLRQVDETEKWEGAPDIPLSIYQPRGYIPNAPFRYRVLIKFCGRNNRPCDEVQPPSRWTEWSDANGIFLVSPDFGDDPNAEPQHWSGIALLKALEKLKEKYKNICTDKLLYYGHSAGGDSSNLFAAWRPDLCRAWAAHGAGVFHSPGKHLKNLPGLVTCGDADSQRYVIGRTFYRQCMTSNLPVVWKTMANHRHDVPPESADLARAFLLYYHNQHLEDIGRETVVMEDTLYIGDDIEGVYYPIVSPKIQEIPVDERILLPSKDVADAWGKPAQ